ncbi:MAG: hypothetical protein QOI96_2056, partial [Verrucomicrobiota bacterium]
SFVNIQIVIRYSGGISPADGDMRLLPDPVGFFYSKREQESVAIGALHARGFIGRGTTHWRAVPSESGGRRRDGCRSWIGGKTNEAEPGSGRTKKYGDQDAGIKETGFGNRFFSHGQSRCSYSSESPLKPAASPNKELDYNSAMLAVAGLS